MTANISASIVADSIWHNKRITTMSLVYPLFIHPQFLTHRVFSRSVSSSRAMPVGTVMRQVLRDPAYPSKFGSNQPGMQAGDELTGWRLWLAKQAWFKARYAALLSAKIMKSLGVHKEVANRVLMPWVKVKVVVTATDWENFYRLRLHEHADPTIRDLAVTMYMVMDREVPVNRSNHLPFLSDDEIQTYGHTDYMRSTARCARVSYDNHDGTPTTKQQDVTLFDKLMGSEIKHASPAEHCAVASEGQHANFNGWRSYRNILGE